MQIIQLISYDKRNDEYKFNLILDPEIGLEKTRNIGKSLYKSFSARVRFASNQNNSILLSDKI